VRLEYLLSGERQTTRCVNDINDNKISKRKKETHKMKTSIRCSSTERRYYRGKEIVNETPLNNTLAGSK
jgi:hypothetical protein